MKNSELFFYLSEILSMKSPYSCYVSSCVCRALSMDAYSFAVALPSPDAVSFAVDLETFLADSPMSVACLDDIPDGARVVFPRCSVGNSVYLYFIIHS